MRQRAYRLLSSRLRTRGAIITAIVLLLALLAADIYVAVAPEYQLARPAPAPAAVSSDDPVLNSTPALEESVAANSFDAETRDGKPKPATKKPNIVTAGFAATTPFQQPDEQASSPLSVAIALMGEPSGVTGNAASKRKGGQIVGPPGFDTLVALGVFGSGGGGGNPGSPPTFNQVDNPIANPVDNNPVDNPGGGETGANPDGGEPPPTIVPEDPSAPPVIETPLPGSLILFASAIAGFSFSRRVRRG